MPDDLAWASTIRDAKAHWDSMQHAMHRLAPPQVVTAAATAALWHFNPMGAVAAVISRCEARLPQIFDNSVLGKLGKLLCIRYPSAATAIWHHVKVQQAAKAGSPTHVLGKLTMAEAGTAWDTHYAQRLQHGCQRRNRLIGQTIDSTTSEVAELFAELDDAARLGISATAARVADEAADVWYGAHCYAIAYTEQVQRVLTGWAHNMQASGEDTRVSNQLTPPTPGGDEAHTQAQHAPVADDHEISKKYKSRVRK